MSASWDAAMRDVLAYVSSHGAVVVKNGEVQAPSVPVVVFDGQVVELEKVMRHVGGPAGRDIPLWYMPIWAARAVSDLLDAAREVARGDGR